MNSQYTEDELIAKMSNGEYCRVNVSECKKIELHRNKPYYESWFLLKTQNGFWLKYEIKHKGNYICVEIDLKSVVKLLDETASLNQLRKSDISKLPNILDRQNATTELRIITLCANCRWKAQSFLRETSDYRRSILLVLEKADRPLLGREIAHNANLKFDSRLRTTLKHFVDVKVITKQKNKRGYVLSAKPKS